MWAQLLNAYHSYVKIKWEFTKNYGKLENM